MKHEKSYLSRLRWLLCLLPMLAAACSTPHLDESLASVDIDQTLEIKIEQGESLTVVSDSATLS